jgi:hypothetical protein
MESKTVAYNIASEVVSAGGWVLYVHVEDFAPTYERFLSSLTVRVFTSYDDAYDAITRLLSPSVFFDLFGIPYEAREPLFDDGLESNEDLVEIMLDALVKHSVISYPAD